MIELYRTYNGRLIGRRTCIWAIEQRHFLNDLERKVTPLFDAEYLRNG